MAVLEVLAALRFSPSTRSCSRAAVKSSAAGAVEVAEVVGQLSPRIIVVVVGEVGVLERMPEVAGQVLPLMGLLVSRGLLRRAAREVLVFALPGLVLVTAVLVEVRGWLALVERVKTRLA